MCLLISFIAKGILGAFDTSAISPFHCFLQLHSFLEGQF